MALIIPKFAYNTGSGVIDFIPTFPPTGKTPFSPLSAVRHDSITSSGIKQCVVERIDEFIVLNFATVPEADLASWGDFMEWVLAGNEFTYYPDTTDISTFYECLLEDGDWTPKWVFFKTYSFNIKIRKAVGLGEHFS